jgi:microcystin-dependent protein
MFAGDTAPAGWAICRGQLYDGTQPQYQALWLAIGTTWGGGGQSSFAVPDFTNKTAFGTAETTFPNSSPNYVFTITATTFDNLANSTTPNNLPARQVISVTSIEQELVVGMVLVDFGVTITGISGGAGYAGGGPGTYNLPNTIVLTLSAALTVGLASQIVNIQAAGRGFGLGSSTTNNLREQQTLQVANHNHGNGFGAGGINSLNQSNNPIQGQDTTGPKPNAFYTINNVQFIIPQKTSCIPSMNVINFIIKF